VSYTTNAILDSTQ